MPYPPPKRRKPIERRAARREGNMVDDTNETKESEVDTVQEPPEQPHDVERTWRRIALAVAAVIIVGSGLCIGKEVENANADAANASSIANANSDAKDLGDNGDKAYALTSPLPEDRIAEKIDEVCPNETYVIKNRNVGTDTSGNPYADYECTVTSGRELVFEARDYVVDENGSKRRGFDCDYVKKVADYHRKSVENILHESSIDYTIDRDGMTYTVKVPDDAACDTLAKAFTSIATEYARGESGYNTSRWLDDTKVIGIVATGTESGSGVTLTCTSTVPDMSSTAEKIKAAVDTAKSANRNGTQEKNADEKYDKAETAALAKKKASQLIGKAKDKAKDERTISTKAGAFVGTTIVKKAKEAVSEVKNASGNEAQTKAEAAAKKTVSRIVGKIKAIENPSHGTGTTVGTTIAEKAKKAVADAKNANANSTVDARKDNAEEEALAKKKLSRILESIRKKTEDRDKGKKSLAATLAERSGTAIEATRTGNAEKLRAKLLGSLGDVR